MKRIYILMLSMLLLSGCYYKSNQNTDNVIDEMGEGVMEAWDDIKGDFSDIDVSVATSSKVLTADDLHKHFSVLKNNYADIKDGIDDPTLARKVYTSAATIDVYKERNEDSLNDEQEDLLDIGSHMKDLLMYHYGQSDEKLSDIQNDIENILGNYKEETISRIETRG